MRECFMKKAFTLVEVIIVVAILGILAAIVLPLFQSNVTEAKEAAAKDNLRILRNTIEFYAAQHNGVPPGYSNDNLSNPAISSTIVYAQLVFAGHYLSKLPKNPFNNDIRIKVVTEFPENADGQMGWIYNRATKTIRLNWPGTDKNGVRYYDY
jgi:prepilin-type N-terminal cleavage/methylation domain-containing protein